MAPGGTAWRLRRNMYYLERRSSLLRRWVAQRRVWLLRLPKHDAWQPRCHHNAAGGAATLGMARIFWYRRISAYVSRRNGAVMALNCGLSAGLDMVATANGGRRVVTSGTRGLPLKFLSGPQGRRKGGLVCV